MTIRAMCGAFPRRIGRRGWLRDLFGNFGGEVAAALRAPPRPSTAVGFRGHLSGLFGGGDDLRRLLRFSFGAGRPAEPRGGTNAAAISFERCDLTIKVGGSPIKVIPAGIRT